MDEAETYYIGFGFVCQYHIWDIFGNIFDIIPQYIVVKKSKK